MQHEQHRVPVTALAFWKQHVILAGEGGTLSAYDSQSKKLLASTIVFDGQAIHGIITSDNEEDGVLVWGGRTLRCVGLDLDQSPHSEHKLGDITQADDWILDAGFSKTSCNQRSKVALVTAHNALTVAPLDDSFNITLEHVVPGSNCILYTAHITWLSPFKCLIASGTAFGDIIVWSSELSDRAGKLSATWQTHFTFCAHEGSVFGVQFSSASIASALGSRKRVLASCSDDRTIRLWDVSDLSMHDSIPADEQRDTGFGSKQTQEAHAPPCLAKVMGHASRIWHLRFVNNAWSAKEDRSPAKLEAVRIVSFGEDACCINWSVELKPNLAAHSQYVLRQTHSQKAHNGKNIWTVAASQDSRIALGAADGAISIRPFIDMDRAASSSTVVPLTAANGTKIGSVRSYSFISQSEVLAITDQGRAMLLTIASSGISKHRELLPDLSELRGYSISTGHERVAFFGGMTGHVYMYDQEYGTCTQIAGTKGKVVGLFSQDVPLAGRIGHTLLVTNIGLKSAQCYQIFPTNLDEEIVASEQIELDFPDNSFMVTSFAQGCLDDRTLRVLGSRSGSIAIYDTRNLSDQATLRPSLCLAMHGKEAVTSIKIMLPSPADASTVYIFSTGRDGTYAVHALETNIEGEMQLTKVHQLSLPFGPNIEGIGYSHDDRLWVWGFRSKQFVVYDISSQREIMTVECGGVHRNWAFQPAIDGGTFMWTKASNIYYERQNSLPFESLNSGGHGREIKTMATAPTKSGLMIATGAEDTNIKLSVRTDGSWRCLHTLQKHNTGIQHLWFSKDGSYLLSSAGFEEFFVWRICHDLPTLGVGIVCESTHPNSGTSDLRIMSFDAQDVPASADVCRHFRITMVYSDSTIKSWQYHDQTWEFLASGDYLTSCLTQCIYTGTSKVITASTDGHLAGWKMTSPEEPTQWSWISRHKVHQNAILAMLSFSISNTSILTITGGDDNALAFSLSHSGREDALSTLVVPRAHAAAVTALAVVKTELNRLWLVTASIDQRIKLWQVDMSAEAEAGIDGIEIKLLQNRFTAVADVSSMESICLDNGRTGVLVCGVGMDLWSVD